MKRHLYLFICLFLLFACDDGDIITVDLEFNRELDNCTNFEDFHLVYDTRQDPNEALILIFPKNEDNNNLFLNPTPEGEPVELDLTELGVRFIYRTYNRTIAENELCQIVPPADLVIQEDYEAFSGTVEVTVTIIDDDEDGIPNELEYGPGGLADPRDSDEDGIPDYIDQDDDNDNVLTEFEIDDENLDGDDDPTTNPLDTDGDGIPDYLDIDDDGDGVETRLEDEDGDGPTNDISFNEDEQSVPYYLNILENTAYDFPEFFIENTYTRTVNTSFFINDIDLNILRTDFVDMGVLESSYFISNEED